MSRGLAKQSLLIRRESKETACLPVRPILAALNEIAIEPSSITMGTRSVESHLQRRSAPVLFCGRRLHGVALQLAIVMDSNRTVGEDR